MKDIPIGEYIRQRRRELKLTQSQVCSGICEPATLSRIENGSQAPNRSTASALLQRLGLPDDLYFALVDPDSMAVQTLREEILADSIRFERASREDRPAIRAAGLEKLGRLEKIIDKEDRITRQSILSFRATFGKPDGPYSPEERLDLLMEALRMTVPKIDLEEINLGWYSMEETKLINQIAVTYDIMGQRKKAIDIYRQLLKYVNKHDKALNRYAGHLSLITKNYARALFLEKRYEEALEVAELGQRTCVKYGHYQFLPSLMDLLGGCYYYTGNHVKCREYYLCAYYLYKTIGNERDRLLLEKAAKERLNLEFLS